MPARERDFREILEAGVQIVVRYSTDRGRVVSYAVVLIAEIDGDDYTIRVYDNAHGQCEIHRYEQGEGKQPAESVGVVDPGVAMREAIGDIKNRYEEMIRSWRR